MKLYFVNNMIGQLYGHLTLTMWKLNKKRLSSFWRNTHEVESLLMLCLLIYTYFYGVLTCTLCKVINQAANSVNFDLLEFSSVQATSLWRDLYHRRAKIALHKTQEQGSNNPLCDTLTIENCINFTFTTLPFVNIF